MDNQLYLDILSTESTSGSEAALADMLAVRFKTSANRLEVQEVGDGTRNLYFTWGEPKLVFCTHMDTVPPFIPPTVTREGDDVCFRGRGTCDAKGQIISMWSACQILERQGKTGFGLLLLAGEETGSYGAKAFRSAYPGAEYVIVGEPTDGCMASASKGTKSFGITFKGEAFHSGYPQHGRSAVDSFVAFINDLKSAGFPVDRELGETTWNVGKLSSDNPQNILSPELSFRLYFRTTFASDEMVTAWIRNRCEQDPDMSVVEYGGDTPSHYHTIGGFPTCTVAFGSDAPQLTNFRNKMLCGPGSILVAHRPDEHIMLSELEKATEKYVEIFNQVEKLVSIAI